MVYVCLITGFHFKKIIVLTIIFIKSIRING